MNATTIHPAKPDGKASALELLRALERLNWKRNAPVGSRKALMAALKAAAALPECELGQFADVLATPLIGHVLGVSFPYVSGYGEVKGGAA